MCQRCWQQGRRPAGLVKTARAHVRVSALVHDGPRATKHDPVVCDVTLWAVGRLRRGSRERPLAVFRARVKESVLLHTFC